MEYVSSQPSTTPNPQTADVLNGIGTIKSVSNAPKIGSRMLMELVFLFLINVLLMMLQELVSHVSKDMISLMEFANSLLSTMPSLPIQDVLPGIGITKFVLLAQRIG